jgi:bacterioferritin
MSMKWQGVQKSAVLPTGELPAGSRYRQALIAGLNHDLAGEYRSILMYIHFSAKLTGSVSRELRAHFQAKLADDQGHAQFLSDTIAALGGEPTTKPRSVPHANLPSQMLAYAAGAVTQAIADYAIRIVQAEACDEPGLKTGLENRRTDKTRHKEEFERIIAGWSDADPEETREINRWQDDGGQG